MPISDEEFAQWQAKITALETSLAALADDLQGAIKQADPEAITTLRQEMTTLREELARARTQAAEAIRKLKRQTRAPEKPPKASDELPPTNQPKNDAADGLKENRADPERPELAQTLAQKIGWIGKRKAS